LPGLRGVILQTVATNITTTSAVAGSPLLFTALEVVAALALIAAAGAILSRIAKRVALRAGASKSVAKTADQWIAVLTLVAGIATFASLTGLSSDLTTLTISGIAGLAASLALQTTLSNIIAGILMLRDGVLRLGDDIEFSSVRGEVVRLSLRTTWLKRQDGVIVVIGNSNLSAGPIVNHTAGDRLGKKL